MEQRKTIRLKFVGFYPRFDPNNNLFIDILQKHFGIELVDIAPDFVICSHFGSPFELNQYDCPRIFYSGENYSPDFTCHDYALTYNDIAYGDRFFRMPYFLADEYCRKAFLSEGEPRCVASRQELLAQKIRFCDFLFSHESAGGMREALLHTLERYKRVDCAGILYNNMPGGETVPYDPSGEGKLAFIRGSKFSIAAESCELESFVTEKLVHAWLAGTVPIYFGAPDIGKWFNPAAFIDAHNYATLDELLAEVKRLDQDEDAWYQMVCQPLFREPNHFETRWAALEAFLVNIFEQEPATAYRRALHFSPSSCDASLKEYNQFLKSPAYFHYLKSKRWNQRRYWAKFWMHKVLPGLFKEPDEAFLR